MSLLRFLGLERAPDHAGSGGDSSTVRRVVEALDRQEPATARYVARFAYILGRVARADLAVTRDETQTMERILMERGGLPEEQAILVVQIAKSQSDLFGGTEDYLVTRQFAESATHDQKLALLDCCFAVSAADHEVSGEEESVVRQIASELGLTHGDYIAARSAFRDYLAVLKQPAPRG